LNVCGLLLAGLVGGCSTPEKQERARISRHFKDLNAQEQRIVVDASDGISELEAYRVACDYFRQTGLACGAVGLPREEETQWRVPVFTGVAGLHTEDVLVDKAQGSRSVIIVGSYSK
jgi:hypothetical protein